MSRKMFLCLSLLVFSVKSQNITVKEKSGGSVNYPVADVVKATFSNGKMLLYKSDGSKPEFALSAIRFLSFSATPLGVSEVVKPTDALNVYPGLVTDFLNLDYIVSHNKTVVFSIHSVEGRTLFEQKLSCVPGINRMRLSVSDLPKGIYICCLKDGAQVITKKIIKQ